MRSCPVLLERKEKRELCRPDNHMPVQTGACISPRLSTETFYIPLVSSTLQTTPESCSLSNLCFSLRRTHILESCQLPVDPPPSHQLFMRPSLNYLPLIKHIDYISTLDGGQTMGDGQGGAAPGGGIEGGLDDAFGGRVESGCGFV